MSTAGGAQRVESIDGQGDYWFFANSTAPASDIGVPGDWALCVGSTTPGVPGIPTWFGPKTDPSTWPAGAANAGPTGPAGPVAAWKGAWAASTTYAGGDLVQVGGGLWAAKTAFTTGARFNPANWTLLSTTVAYTPVTGQYLAPQHWTSFGSNQALTAGRLSWAPIKIGPRGVTCNGLVVVEGSTVQSGGSTTMSVALYADDGTTGLVPDGTLGPLASGTVDLTSGTGNKIVAVSNLALAPGIYHVASLYVVGTAPTTPATIGVVNGSTAELPSASANGLTKGYYAASQTALPNGSAFPTATASVSNEVTWVALRIA